MEATQIIHYTSFVYIITASLLMHYKYTLLFIILSLLLPSLLYADCSREDINFYLEKGFSQEQITQLCSTASSTNSESTPDYTPYQQQVIIYKDGGKPEAKDGLTVEERAAFNDLKLGADVTALKLTPEDFSYTAKLCLRSGQSPNEHERFKSCTDVSYVIQRKDLIVHSSGKKLLFFGTGVVGLEGSILATPKQSFESYPIEFRKALERDFHWKENGSKTSIPVRGDFSVTRLVNALRVLADTYKVADASQKNHVVETNDEKNKETVGEHAKEKKKKKWWNPFD